MNSALFIKMLLTRLVRFKLKSLFMMLGIIISVTAVILVQTLGAEVRIKFNHFIHDTFPANAVYLSAGTGFMGGGQGAENLRMADVNAVVEGVSGIEQYDPMVFGSMSSVVGPQRRAYVSIVGTSEKNEVARNRSVSDGVYFSERDVREGRRVALIGTDAAQSLFGSESPIGQSVIYKNVTFEVIGLLNKAGADPHGRDLDNELHVPYTILKDKILTRDYISGVTFVLDESRLNDLDAVVRDMTAVMRRQHHLSDYEKNDFTVIHSGILMQMVAEVYRTFDIFLPSITAIAFLVSAIVILNIMLAVVKERTPEIGLRKALGATPGDLRLLISVEVLVLSIVGAIIGACIADIIIVVLRPTFARNFGIEDLQLSWPGVLVSVALATLSGLLGAALPASRASRLDPVAALA